MMMFALIVILGLLVIIPLLTVVLDSQLGRAMAARLERGREVGLPVDGRVAALEAEVERLSGEVRRLTESQEFLQRLVEERPALPPGDEVS